MWRFKICLYFALPDTKGTSYTLFPAMTMGSELFFAGVALLWAFSTPVQSQSATSQSSRGSGGSTQDTQTRGYWIDPSTGLMWAGKDNGTDINWHKAMRYCHDLRLGGHDDWRLANIGELQGIFDATAKAPGLNPRSRWHDAEPMKFHVKGNLFLTGNQWSSTTGYDDRGRPSGYAWRFDFNEGRQFDGDELGFSTNKRALCVRRAGS